MKKFIEHNSKETIEKLISFMKEELNEKNVNEVFQLVLKTS